MIFVTSFSKKIYNEYGRSFLDQIDYLPGKLIVYTEYPIVNGNPRIETRSLFEIEGLLNFLTYLKNFPKANGMVEQKGETRYDYNFDIWKFCRKMFAQYDVFKESDKVFWLDTDIKIKKEIPEKFLEDLFDGEALVLLDRPGFHSETGFVGFDTHHDDFPEFEKRYKEVLRSGKVFTFPRWHDCQCLDWAREGKGKNLSPKWKLGDDLDVFPFTVLDEYMLHYKGNRKKFLMT